uniref:peptidoglycan binding domain-containing protein n=1 Tax=Acetatifactor sp. TaxID=1872090 RepID=UPI00405742C9
MDLEKKEEQKAEVEQNQTEKPKKKKKTVLIAIICLLLVLFAGAVIFYWRVAVYYEAHFFPNTTVNGFTCDNMEVEQVVSLLDDEIYEYNLEVSGRINEEGEIGVIGEIAAKDIDLHYLGTKEGVDQLLDLQNPWLWVEAYMGSQYSRILTQGVEFDEEKLNEYVQNWDAFQEMIKPQNASISEYSEADGYTVIPEVNGTQLEEKHAIEHIANAILMGEVSVDLAEMDCYVKPSVTSDDAELNKTVNEINKWLSAEITYDWNGNEVVVDKELISQWVSIENNKATLNEEAVAKFVSKQANAFDTYGRTKTFTTTAGVQLNLVSASYGWKTDREGEAEELIGLIYEGSTETREPVYIRKGRWKGANDIGNSYVEADMTNQHLYLYWEGVLVLETDFVSGDMATDCATPQGIFGITYKTTNAILRGGDYATPVFYWMPFFGNYGMHDATWRTEFGGDIYLTDGSHGCLNLPLDKAEAIYNYMSDGFPVICYY